MNKQKLLERIDQLIELGISSIIQPSTILDVDQSRFKQFRVESYTFIEKIYDTKHRLYLEFIETSRVPFYFNLQKSLSILRAIRSNIEGDWILTQRGLLAAEIFEDFFDMAAHLLEEGYKDAAAVIIGSLLEQHLKEICKRNSIEIQMEKDGKLIFKKAEQLNIELHKKVVYNLSDQKQVTAWLGRRNDAAHGEYKKYDQEQIKYMLDGVRNFISRIN